MNLIMVGLLRHDERRDGIIRDMAQFDIKVDLSHLASAHGIITAEVFPLLHQAVRAVAQKAQIDWIKSVHGAKLWSGEKDAYAGSIKWMMTSDFEAVVWSDYRYAEEIELGRPPRDLKRMLNTSLKVRVGKSGTGKRYLIIPFRHNVPGSGATALAMPQSVYALAKEMSPSSIVGQTHRVSGTGAYNRKTKSPYLVKQNTYQWGDRLPAGLTPKMKPHHATDIHAGMVRFNTSTGAAKSSAYLTFRVMQEGSPGWIVPAKPGLFLARGVAQSLQPLAENAFRTAISKTV